MYMLPPQEKRPKGFKTVNGKESYAGWPMENSSNKQPSFKTVNGKESYAGCQRFHCRHGNWRFQNRKR